MRQLQDKMAALSGPQDQLFSQVQQLERVVKDKQAQLSAAAKQVTAVSCPLLDQLPWGQVQVQGMRLSHGESALRSLFACWLCSFVCCTWLASAAQLSLPQRRTHTRLLQASSALAGKEEAQQAARSERLRREAAEQRAEQLQVRLVAGHCRPCYPFQLAC